MQTKEEEMRQMFVQRVKEKESELKEAEREVWIYNLHVSVMDVMDGEYYALWDCSFFLLLRTNIIACSDIDSPFGNLLVDN
mgnify:CR=1 FL=1